MADDNITWFFQIIYRRGGECTIQTKDMGIGLAKLKKWHESGFISDIHESNGAYSALVSDERYLSFAFKKR